VEDLRRDFYQEGLSQTKNLANEVGSFLLEKNVLALNKAIIEVAQAEDLLSVAILDHQNKIVVPSDSEMVHETMPLLEDISHTETIEGVSIQHGTSSHGTETVAFLADVSFSGVQIGTAYVTLSGQSLQDSTSRYKTRFIFGLVSSLLFLAAILVTKDSLSRRKAKQKIAESRDLMKMGPYLLQKKVAQGGMAELFVASYERQAGFKKIVAVKRVLPHLADNPEFISMFTREARLAALLQHPNVVQTFDFGEIQNTFFISMEYIRGKNLAQIMAKLKKGLTVDMGVFIASNVAGGLNYSHSKKDEKSGKPLEIVHRDISPQNILISFQGEVKISDFGISKAASEVTLTDVGVIKGKLAYLAPEQALGLVADHRSDIYSLGVVFYEMISGQRLHKFATDIQAIRDIPEEEISPIKDVNPEVPEELNRIIMRCLEKKPELRYQSAQELMNDLVVFKQSLSITYDNTFLANFMAKHFKDEQDGFD